MKPIPAMIMGLIVFSGAEALARDNGTVAPPSAGAHGPMSSADRNRDGTVTWAEWQDFLRDGPYRRYGFLNYFDMLDKNNDGFLSKAERSKAEPRDTYDDVDFNRDGVVSRAEAKRQVAGRLYREMPGEDFFNLLDMNGNGEVSPYEITAAHAKGLLPDG